MNIFKTPNLELLLCDYGLRKKRYRSACVCAFFSLKDGKTVAATDAMASIYKLYPELVLDDGLPKIHGEWALYGKAYRMGDKDYNLLSVQLDGRVKEVLADFRDIEEEKCFSLEDPQNVKRLLFRDKTSTAGSGICTFFHDLPQDDPARIRYLGKFSDKMLPGFYPDDFSYEYSNCAPADQRIPGVWTDGSSYCLAGFFADGEVYQGKLPVIDVRLISMTGDLNKHELFDNPLNLDTVKFFPEAGLGVMMWHGMMEVDIKNDYTVCLAVDAGLYASKDGEGNIKVPHSSEFIDLALDQLRRNQPPEKPEHRIAEKVKEVVRESREVRRSRYCNIYMEYFNFMTVFQKLPLVIGYAYENAGLEGIMQHNDWDAAVLEKIKNLSPDDPYYRLVNNIPLKEEEGFSRAMSSLLDKHPASLEDQDFLEMPGHDKLEQFVLSQFFLGHIKKPVRLKYRNFGVDCDGDFELPAGIILPQFVEKEFVGGLVRPKGLFCAEGEVVIPGSRLGATPSWHGSINVQNIPRMAVDDIGAGILLAEESFHQLDVIYMPRPDYPVIDEIKQTAMESFEILVPAPDDRIRETEELWKNSEYSAKVRVVPLGRNKDGELYRSLLERMQDDVPVSFWLDEVVVGGAIEPIHLPGELYDVALDDMLAEKMDLDRNTMDFVEGALKRLDKEKQNVLSKVGDKKARAMIEQQFAGAAAEIKANAKKSDVEIMKKSMQAHLSNFAKARETAKSPEVVKQIDDLEKQSKEEFGRVFAMMDLFKTTRQNAEEARKALEKSIDSNVEEAITRNNLGDADFDYLRSTGVRNFPDVYIENREFQEADLSELSFKDSTFDRVTFKGVNFSFTSFEGCTFNGCVFDACTMRSLRFSQCSFLECRVQNAVWDSAVLEDCSLLNCMLIDLNFYEGVIRRLTFETGVWKGGSLTGTKLDILNMSFVEVSDIRMESCTFDYVRFESCQLSGQDWRGSAGESVTFNNGTVTETCLNNTVFNQINIHGDIVVEKLEARECHWHVVVIMENTVMTGGDFTHSVWEDACIRGADLSQGCFRFLVAKDISLTESTVQKADFFHANLLRANMSGTRLGGTVFDEANLFAADFTGSFLEDNSFRGTNLKRTLISLFRDF